MANAAIYLFGAPRVELDGAPLVTDTRKATALLAYLAVTRQAHTRDAIAALLWPELDQTRARAALRRTLSALQHGRDLPWLVTAREQVQLALDAQLWCDVHEFEQCVAACPLPLVDADACAAYRPQLERAAALYTEDFLAGFTLRDSAAFDDWQFFQTEGYRHTLARVLDALVQCATVAHDWSAAIQHARRRLALDPLHEPAHRQLMQLYAWDNQHAAALRQYQECVRILDEELGVPPLEETTALDAAIRKHQAPLPPDHPVTAPPALAAIQPTQPPAAIPLLGRAIEWATLQADYDAISVRGGRGRLFVVTGEAGAGKTALATAFAQAQARRGAVLLATAAYPGETPLSYAPLSMLLQRAAAEPALRARLAALDPAVLAEVGRLVPALVQLHPAGAAPPPDPVTAQSRFFTALAATFTALLAGDLPGVLLIDDIDCADRATLDWLTYFVRRLEAQRICVMLVWRHGELLAGHHLHRHAADGKRQGQVTWIDLAPLSRFDVARWVRLALPERTAEHETLADRLYAETGGLPFFVTEYLHMLAQDDAASHAAAWRAPASVRDFLLARLAPMTEVARQVLAAAAVIGRSFDLPTVTAASGRSEDETVAALEELLARRLVIETDADRLDFAHAQLRQIVYDDLTHLRRRLLHRRVGDALAMQARRTGDEAGVAGALVQHYRLGGELEKAAHFARLAGEQAQRVYANRAAVDYFRQALALGAPDACAIHSHLGDLHTLLGEYSQAEAAYTAALTHCPVDQRADLEHRLGRLFDRLGDMAAAVRHYACAHELLPPDATSLHARVLTDWSLAVLRSGEIGAATDLAQQGLRAAEVAGDAAALARSQTLLCLLARRQGDVTAALAAGSAAVAAARQQQDVSILAAALNSLALVYADAGDPAHAIPLVEEALTQATRIGDRHRAAALHNTLADLHHAGGQEEQAMAQLKQAVVIFAEIGGAAGGENAEIWMLREW